MNGVLRERCCRAQPAEGNSPAGPESRRTRAAIWSFFSFFSFFFPAHFHYFTTVWKWCFMKWTSSGPRNVQISNVAAPLPPTLLSWIPLFCYFWLSFFQLTPQTCQYSMTISSIFPKSTYYSLVILPRSLFKSWFLYSLLINIRFTSMPVCAITAIVCKGQKSIEMKQQNLDTLGIRNGPEFWILGSWFWVFFFMNTIIVLDTVWISSRISPFH